MVERDSGDVRFDAIAIVGMSCRFPGAADLDAFWGNLRDGVDCTTRMVSSRTGAVRGHGLLEGIEHFDADFFRFTPKEAELTDPQLRIALECCWEALESAAYNPDTFPGPIGVFFGSSLSSYLLKNLASNPRLIEQVGGTQVLIRNDKDFIPTTISHRLDLRGPSMNLSSACSTSLVALHVACQALITCQCDLALAGGASIHLPQPPPIDEELGAIYSPDGYCRAFDARAAGTIGGNGAGVVVLKRLADAIGAGDFIHAVILGSAVNNDGAGKLGFTAPGVDGQAKVIEQALANAGVDLRSIALIECHGTGTPLGDAVEVAALKRVFHELSSLRGQCALGSVKTSIGHLDAAAGIAGLMKAALALQHRVVPPTLHFETPHPESELNESPFYVPVRATPVPSPPPRMKTRAGVSAFGVGGTNAHVVLEEPPTRCHHPSLRPWCVVPLSAATPDALASSISRLSRHLSKYTDIPVHDIAFTLGNGRRAFEFRRAFVCDSTSGLRVELERSAREARRAAAERLAFVFRDDSVDTVLPGGLIDIEPVFRRALEECWSALGEVIGNGHRAAFWDAARTGRAPGEGPLRHGLVFAFGLGLSRLWTHWGVVPSAVAGSGRGELLAAVLSGVMQTSDAIRAIVDPQALLGVQLSPPRTLLLSRGGQGRVDRNEALDPAYWVAALESPSALAVNRVESLRSAEFSWLEFTPGPSGEQSSTRSFMAWPHDSDAAAATRCLCRTLGSLWEDGVNVDWSSVHAHEKRLRVRLPTYPFQRKRYWVEAPVPKSFVPDGLEQLDRVELQLLQGAAIRALGSFPGLQQELDLLCATHLKRYVSSGLPQGATSCDRDVLQTNLRILPQFTRFLDFALGVLGAERALEVVDGEVRLSEVWSQLPEPEQVEERVCELFPRFSGLARFLRHCAAGYPDAFAHPRAGLQLLYEDGAGTRLKSELGERTAEHSLHRVYVALAAELVARRAASGEPLRILEIGAGSGLLSWEVLRKLEGLSYSYEFTDISRGFLLQAENEARARGIESIRFRQLDISKAPGTQGFALETYDIVLALDCIHATPVVQASLANAKSLLAPGGFLCVVEALKAWRFSHMIWGLSDAWWNFKDASRRDSPLLPIDAWEQEFKSVGFEEVWSWPRRGALREESDYGLIVSRREQAIGQTDAMQAPSVPTKGTDIAKWFYVPVWRRSLNPAPAAPAASDLWLVLMDEGGMGAALRDELLRRGCRVVTVACRGQRGAEACRFQIDANQPADYEALLSRLRDEGALPNKVLHLWSFTTEAGAQTLLERLDVGLTRGLHSLLWLAQAFGKLNVTREIRLIAVYNQVHDISGDDALSPEKASLTGALKLIPQEYPNISCLGVDVVVPAQGSNAERRFVQGLVDEGHTMRPELFAAYRGNNRWVSDFEPVEFAPDKRWQARLRPRGVYLITGGLGGIGLELASFLSRNVEGCRLILVGRSAFPTRQEWETLATAVEPAQAALANTARKLLTLEAEGTQVAVLSADVADRSAMARVFSEAEARFGELCGVIHAAAVADRYGVIQNRTPQTLEESMRAKVHGTLVLHELLEGRKLDFFVLCSALGSVLHGLKSGEVGYVAANDFLDSYASYRAGKYPGLTVSIGWTDWSQVGMAARAMDEYVRKRGFTRRPTARVSHPLLGIEVVSSGHDAEVVATFSNVLRTETCWALDGHRIQGVAVLPGTAFLEVAVAASARQWGTSLVELRDVSLLAPLAVADGHQCELRTTLRRTQRGLAFRVESRAASDETWLSHAQGELLKLDPVEFEPVDLATLWEQPAMHSFELEEQVPKALGDSMRFGERWNCVRRVRYGGDWGLAELSLPAELASDIQDYHLHPALVDCAFAFLCPYLLQGRDESYLPVHYQSIRILSDRSLPATLTSHARASYRAQSGSLELSVRVLDQSGQMHVEVSGLTARPAALAAMTERDPRQAVRRRAFALDIERPGELESLMFRPVDAPVLGPHEVEIDIAAAGLNFKDVLVALGKVPPPDRAGFRFGLECSGVVVRVGAAVQQFSVGDEVMTFGASWFAPSVVVPAAWVALKPARLSFSQAAAIPVAFTVAALALRELGAARAGDHVLIHSAAGGVGLALVQLATRMGAMVHATAGTLEKRAFLKAMKVHSVHDSRTAEFVRGILLQTGNLGVDLAIDSLGGDLRLETLSAVRPGGRFVELGLGGEALTEHGRSQGKHVSFLRLDPSDRRLMDAWSWVTSQCAGGHLEPLPVTVFAIEDMAAAFDHMARAKHLGKVVISYEGWAQYSERLSVPRRSGASIRSEVDYIRSLVQGVSNEEGIEVFARILASEFSKVVVSTQPLGELLDTQRLAAKLGPQAFLESVSVGERPAAQRERSPKLLHDIEQRLVQIWRELLGLQEIGVNDNFFDLGGDSLVAIRVLSCCEREFEVEQSLASLFDHPTIAELARQIAALRAQSNADAAVGRELVEL